MHKTQFDKCTVPKQVLYNSNSNSILGHFIVFTKDIYYNSTKAKSSKSRANNAKDTSKNVIATLNPNNQENSRESLKMKNHTKPKVEAVISTL